MAVAITVPVSDILTRLGSDGTLWRNGLPVDGDTRLTIRQAIRLACPPADRYLVEQVAERTGWGTRFNNDPATTWAAVSEALNAHAVVSDTDLATAFGPGWPAIRAVVAGAAGLTSLQVARLANAVTGLDDTAMGAALDAVGVAATDAPTVAAIRAGRLLLARHAGFDT